MEEIEYNLPTLVQKVIDGGEFDVPEECHSFVERCLRIENYSIERAKILLDNLRVMVQNLKDLWENYDPSLVQPLISTGMMRVLHSRDQSGRLLVHLRFGQWNPSQIDYQQKVTTLIIFLGWIVGQSAETQRKGIVVIHDLTSFKMEHIWATKLSLGTQLIAMMQSGAPGRIEAIHTINYPRVFWYVYKIFKPFMKEDLTKRFFLHGNNLAKLHGFIKPDVLPLSLGGPLKEEEAYDDEILKKFCLEKELHTDLLKFGFPRY